MIAIMLSRCRSLLILLVVFASFGCAQDDTLIDPFGDYTLKLPFAKTTRVGKGVSTERTLIETWSDPSSGILVKFMVTQSDTNGLTEAGLLDAGFQTAVQEQGFHQMEFALGDQQRQRVGSVRLFSSEAATVASIVKRTPKGMITINLSGQKSEAVKQALTWIYANNK